MERREMLSEYFSLDISASGQVESLPLLLRDYTPQLDNLPDFLMRLGPQVSTVRSVLTSTDIRHDPRWTGGPKLDVLILHAPKSLLDQDVVQIASLSDLYKVFERC
jgi:DNA mismatch repair protein MLH1